MKPLTKGSLFTGAMGADLAAEEAGMQSAWYCEIDPAATRNVMTWICRRIIAEARKGEKVA